MNFEGTVILKWGLHCK